jgi:hypothetical protein
MRLLLPTYIVSTYLPIQIHRPKLTCIDEAVLRKTIIDLQTYRRLGLSTTADIEKYNIDLNKRVRCFLRRIFYIFLISNSLKLKSMPLEITTVATADQVVAIQLDPIPVEVKTPGSLTNANRHQDFLAQQQDLPLPLVDYVKFIIIGHL